MDDREQQRKVRHRLAVLRHADEVTGNVARTCRYYGISRQCFYTWKRRFDEPGPDGLKERSTAAPITAPLATHNPTLSARSFTCASTTTLAQ